ncbi:AAA family ATPase [Gracilibacillus salinarum]|uniref:AAA family ATPase n=1 Tax=Gracilibacillus salinarum TaxID=2932255 RepID=A0ABY4GKL6_9BACI|nr:AAA family ATPase [Gracilibacillus salinarum]UOQ83992.1 AAA family ATPase [Gracilibacillus salinarum]
MEDIIKDLEDWLSKRPLWIQYATNRLLQGNIKEKDVEDFVSICKTEIEDVDKKTVDTLKYEKGKIRSGEENIALTIEGLSNIQGINALSPRNPLKLNENLNIIYGQNGSGKSSYVRLFKHLCGSKNSGSLYGNVYKEDTEQNCNIKYNINGEKVDINWSPHQGSLEDLNHIEIYDADDAYTYVNDENEVTYEPFVLRLISGLIELCNQVSTKISQEIEGHVSVLPLIPKNYDKTEYADWYKKISHNVSLEEVAAICEWDNELEEELIELVKRMSEKNPMDKAKVLRKTIVGIDRINDTINKMLCELSDEKCEMILTAKKTAESKRKAAEEDAKKVFSNAPINTIDNESWRLLWEQARQFSESYVYESVPYPNVDEESLCVLCQQPLDDDAKSRLVSFEAYVQGNLEIEAKDAEDKLKIMIDNLPDIPEIESFKLMLDSAGIYEEEVRTNLISLMDAINVRKEDIQNFKDNKNIKQLPVYDFKSYLKAEKSKLEKQAQSYEEDSEGESRSILKNKKISLEAKKWLNEHKDNIVEEIHRLNNRHSLNEAKKLTRTQGLSTKKSNISERLITEAYVRRFDQELGLLGASYINIELAKTRTHRGQVLHEIKLSNPKRSVKATEILSEGEQRIVSFAAFLADISGKQVNSPLILDDPISSLDQEYEEAVVARLVNLSLTKQIIVFTHRISLLSLLEDAAKTTGVNTNIIGVRHEDWGSGELGGTPMFAKKPDSALNVIYNERLPKAKKILEETGREEYDLIAKGICSDFRIILENTIETYLLSDIVRRFRRSITTMGKINKLYKIEQSDCEMFDKFMTKYSRYEHSQSIEAPVPVPSPQELNTDIEEIMGWTKEFKKR